MLHKRTGELPDDGEVFVASVVGTSKTKGSLKNVARKGQKPHLAEQVAGSTAWKDKMKKAFQRLVRAGDGSNPALALPGYPYNESVVVYATFVFEKPATFKGEFPNTMTFGDTDKLQRNLGDALQQSGVLREDSRIIEWHAVKRFKETWEPHPCVYVRIIDARTHYARQG